MCWLRLVDPSDAENDGDEYSDEERADNEGADGHMGYVPPVRVRDSYRKRQSQNRGELVFSDHQRWFAAFLLAFPEVAVVPLSNERDAPLALISTSGSPQCGRSQDRALQWLSRSLRPVTGRNCYSRLPRRSARKLAKKAAADRRTKRIAALPLLPRSTADHIILSDAAWPHRGRSPLRWTHSKT